MARIEEPPLGAEAAWKEWVASRPEIVRKVAERFDPWSLYRMKSTGQRVTVYSFSENGTITVNVLGDFNLTIFDRRVFGINPDDLEPCELPRDDEAVGAMLTSDEVDENIDALRVMHRPDLWEMGLDGKAKRRT